MCVILLTYDVCFMLGLWHSNIMENLSHHPATKRFNTSLVEACNLMCSAALLSLAAWKRNPLLLPRNDAYDPGLWIRWYQVWLHDIGCYCQSRWWCHSLMQKVRLAAMISVLTLFVMSMSGPSPKTLVLPVMLLSGLVVVMPLLSNATQKFACGFCLGALQWAVGNFHRDYRWSHSSSYWTGKHERWQRGSVCAWEGEKNSSCADGLLLMFETCSKMLMTCMLFDN